jgi:GntR family transcriptional regulator/MocR family aminotransferase
VLAKHRGEVAVTRESEIRGEATETRFAALQPADREVHPQAQQILVQGDAGVRAKDVGEMKRRDAEHGGEMRDSVRRRRISRHELLRARDERGLTASLSSRRLVGHEERCVLTHAGAYWKSGIAAMTTSDEYEMTSHGLSGREENGPSSMTTNRPARASASPPILAHLPIRRGTGTPLHRQIYDGLRRAILEGLLRPGQRIPSTRGLATELGVSRLPVLAAYEQLLHEGYLTGRTGAGTFVSDALPDETLRPGPAARTTGRSPATPASVERRLRERHQPGLRPFRMNLPALDEFPHVIWSRLVARHAHAMTAPMMAYGDPAGVAGLRVAVAEHLRTARAVRCEADNVLMVSGSQAGLTIAAHVLLSPGDAIAIEEPGYLGAHAAFRGAGIELIPVPVDDEGLDVAALYRTGRRVRSVYITPSHQYPLGPSMSASRRLALLEWAERRDAWIIEDDYDSEYRYVSRPLGALQGMSDGRRVVYIGTFSKVLFPAVRVGYLVVPPALWDDFIRMRDAVDIFTPTLYQLALADFIREGHFARHLRRMRLLYQRRRDALLEGLARHCAELVTVHNADAGLHLAAVLHSGARDIAVIRRMTEQGLSAMPLSTCYLEGNKQQGLLLGFGGFDERRVMGATRQLRDVLLEFS